jgi:hypothetical protein
MPREIPPKGGAENSQHIVLKTENLDNNLRKTLIMAFAGMVNPDNDSTSAEQLWNWVKSVSQQTLYDSSEWLCTHGEHLLDIAETQTQPTMEDKLKWIHKCHVSPVAGHPGRAKTTNLLNRSHSWNQIRNDVECYIRNCHTCQ